MTISVVNRSLRLFTKVVISSTFIADIYLISDTYKLCITSSLFFFLQLNSFQVMSIIGFVNCFD